MDEFDENESGKTGSITDLLKKVIVTGASAVFLTEDAIKSLSKEFKLPKELLSGIISSAKASKEEIVEKVTSEFSKQLKKIDLKAEFAKFLEEHDMDVQLKIKFQKREPKDS